MLAIALLAMSEATSATAAGGCADVYITCTVDGGGASVGMTQTVLARAKNGLDLQTGEPDNRVWEYASATACQFSTPGGINADAPCSSAVQACVGNTPTQGLGPQIRLYRRELDPNGLPLPPGWIELGLTCSPDLVPGKPVLGMAQILAAFHNTPWARPTVHIQPEGNITLVTLTTYFQVSWPEAGYQPGEINTTTMLGNKVRIRPTNHGYTYIFGDGTTSGPTISAGGVYPNGDITHVYAKAGIYDSHIDITYGGEFSVGGRQWLPIPDTVTIAGQPQPLTVTTARARLVIR